MKSRISYANDSNVSLCRIHYVVLIVGNLLSLLQTLFGAALGCTATYVVLIYGYMGQVFGGGVFIPAVYVLLVCGVLASMTGLVGFYDFTHENRCTSAITAIGLICIATTVTVAGVLVIVFPNLMQSNVLDIMRTTLPDYGRSVLSTKAWDEMQSFLRCCAIHNLGWEAYIHSTWYNVVNGNVYEPELNLSISSPYYQAVPATCCWLLVDPLTGFSTNTYRDLRRCRNWQYGPPMLQSGPHNDALYYRGCYPVLTAYMQIHAKYLFLLSIILVILSVAIVVLLICGKLTHPDGKKYT